MATDRNRADGLLRRFWRDRAGVTSPMALILLTTIVAMGALVGLVSVRDHIVQQFGDLAVALDALDQSYSYDIGRDENGDGDFNDANEFQLTGSFADASTLTDPANDAPAGLDLTEPATAEGS